MGTTVTDDLQWLEPHSLDVIFLSHVFEHLSQLRETLARLRGLLRPDGLLCLEVPNARSLRAWLATPWLYRHCGLDERYRAFPIHLAYYGARSLRRLLETQGFRIECLTTMGLGLDELFFEPEAAETDNCLPKGVRDEASARPKAPAGLLKQRIKRAFFDRCLGENLIVAVRPIGSQP